ncbi:orotate phosphoribosyltransferase [archaeon]|jgi:orotate phosphoribosyltransferase|nr:orotate phosphoribosyltransferase [archaeon]MBT3721727.1 orotate phosphoribosyltransferase [archaeon]MBT4022385.1 orotate phosphoribosyltransferase [archaeon]MBT4273263.1 orotate phosphoribosyltransferase [archaeon]MBT4461294.1 orotate phosphoribosyltransferase [archaeon]
MKQQIAEILLTLKAVKIQPNNPFTFTSGLISPIYIDNRLVISFPEERKKIVKQFIEIIKSQNLEFDVVAGVATAGIHWAAWLAAYFDKPMIYIRGKVKSHGRQNQIEGLLKHGQKVLVIEDHISTGGSSVAAVNTVREVGGKVTECLAITTYEFVKANNLYFIHPFLNFNPKKSLY